MSDDNMFNLSKLINDADYAEIEAKVLASMSDEHITIMARAMRAAVIKNTVSNGMLTREDALELLNAPLSPDEPHGPVYDDREMLDWTLAQFIQFMQSAVNN